MGDRENGSPDPALEESDEEENYYESPAEAIREFGQNKLMDRAQRALTKELKENNLKLKEQLHEKLEELKRVTLERENLGVQLYGHQQQLARVQVTLETAHSEYNNIVDAKLQEEEMLRDISKNNAEQQALYDEYIKQHKKYANELESLNETIRQIQKYNEEVKSEIAITRRATYKTEQSMQIIEKKQETNDLLVDDLNKKVSQLKEKTAAVIKQYETQTQDTNDAKTVLQETINELELIEHEKKQLIIQWKAAIASLSRRDEALAQATEALAVAENSVHDYDMEIESARRELQRAQAAHESLVSLRDRLENELTWVENSLNTMRIEKDALDERYALLKKSLAQTDTDTKKLDLVAKALTGEHEAVIKNLQTVTLERQKLEENLDVIHSVRNQVNKSVVNTGKEQMKLLKKIHEKENEVSEAENEISRTKVECLNLNSIIDQLKEQLGVINKEVQEKEAMVAKYQLEQRQRNDEIEKKMYRVDRLNKKYEKMVENAGGEENLGPLENTIKNLKKEIESVDLENKETEREWLRRQTEMVNYTAECEKIAERNNEQQARVTILTQQQLRLTKDLREVKTNLKVSRQLNIDFQKDVSKLNSLISQNHDQETNLQGANFIVESDCVEELKEAEKVCVNLQAEINKAKLDKAALMDEIIECERQALLWEKKIQLDKETRAALDPTVGVTESENMEKEIHRMEVRYESMKREQEKLSIEMEAAVMKKETIKNRYSKPGGENSKSNKELTAATAKKKINALKKEARALAEETSQYTSLFDEKKSQMVMMTDELEGITAQYGETEEVCNQLKASINDLLYQKQLFQERIGYRQKYCTRLKELSVSGVDANQALQIERRVLSAAQSLDNVKEIIQDLASMYPHLREVLLRVDAMTESGVMDGSEGVRM